MGSKVYGVEAPREAFKEAAKVLLSNPEFIEAVKDPRGGPPAASGDLFPEAKTPADPLSAPSPNAPAAAPAAPAQGAALPALFQIIPLRISTAPFREQVDTLRGQVVTVLNAGGSGSGFYISDTLLLTNNHVVEGYSTQKIRFFDGHEIEGRVLATNSRRDVAVIKTESAGVAGLPLQLQNPKLTAPVFVIGSPLGQKQEGSITAGIVSAFRSEKEGPFIQSDVGVTHGNSGGPMFDESGNVIGLVDIGLHDQYGLPTAVNLFIPIADALKTLGIGMGPATETASAKK